MVFLHFFSYGSVTPILSLYLMKELGFSGSQVGMVLAVGAVSSIVSPLISSFIADKLICSERLFAIGHLMGSASMFFLYFTGNFIPFLLGYLWYMAFVGPTIPLSDTIIFHHISDRRHYGKIRVWGTLGWISAAIFLGFFIMRNSGSFNAAFLISSVISLILGFFVFTIPRTAVRGYRREFLPLSSIRVLLKPQILFLTVITFLIFFADRFYFYGSSPYLQSLGIEEKFIMPFLSIGQILEIFAMLTLGFFLTKYSAKKILLFGILVNGMRYGLFLFFDTKLMAIFAVACHGLAYTFIFSTIFIFLDYQSDSESRAGVHQLFRIIYLGFGTLAGNLTAGFVQDNLNIANDYKVFWLIPMTLSFLVFAMMIFFPEKSAKKVQSTNSN
jgi:MFS family permease